MHNYEVTTKNGTTRVKASCFMLAVREATGFQPSEAGLIIHNSPLLVKFFNPKVRRDYYILTGIWVSVVLMD